MERPGVLSYHYLLFMPAFMPAASVFVLSIIIVSPKEHPGLGAACARRHWAFLRARARDGTSNAPEPTEDEAEPDPEPGPEADMDEPDDAEPTAAEYDEFFNSILAM